MSFKKSDSVSSRSGLQRSPTIDLASWRDSHVLYTWEVGPGGLSNYTQHGLSLKAYRAKSRTGMENYISTFHRPCHVMSIIKWIQKAMNICEWKQKNVVHALHFTSVFTVIIIPDLQLRTAHWRPAARLEPSAMSHETEATIYIHRQETGGGAV
ncbi:hypothetical protein EYF80_004282 [Liparis tanakae]|uniref:Uncharacterized protein n=1 Tax=Liparis tanakae TaxID=230148 RepID=A0A4Z2J619_9TELE|nr:hypothetical protein EYF80_004282 [Liparis tanakae]